MSVSNEMGKAVKFDSVGLAQYDSSILPTEASDSLVCVVCVCD